MNQLTKRQQTYNKISNTLACISNRQLEQVLADGKAMHKGIGGTSLQIEIDNTPVFVKKVPLTDLELLPENYMSTANIFNLPMCYQYGIGSAGFGAWRELAAHVMTTNWVITGQCPNFPIMYHWRILKDVDNKIISNEEQVALDKDTAYWENNQEIHDRLKAKDLASHHIYLFMEFIPSHLYDWLKQQLLDNKDAAIEAVKLVEHQIQETNDFMDSQNFLHMDAHFENILTDGKQLYYSDFGLALSDKFTLSNIEKHFIKDNANYDYASSAVNLMHTVLTSYLGKNNWDMILSKFTDPKFDINIPISVKRLLSKYHGVALKMHEFYKAIQRDKSTPFPSSELKELLPKIKQVQP
ncbi:MAG: hypothetical protein HOL58_06800 [Francisellaceae bacterium]|nr:hypothetical protein [Francisellaceae bacterium]